MKTHLLLALALLGACDGASSKPSVFALPHQANVGIDWRDQMIYQIVIDRFDDGDHGNDFNIAPSVPGRYHGGDWQGVINHLDYLKTLGVTTLWISPVVKNTESDAGFASYHGYWTQDFVRPNPHFGDLEKLRELVDTAHKKGFLVILDVVVNHVGQLFYYDINGNGQPDDYISGGGTSHTCVQVCDQPATASQCSADELSYCAKGASYLERIIEWDPEYDPRGIQGWTSLGFSGPATIRFPDWPALDCTPPERPPAWFGWPDDKPWFDDPSWYHRRGRVYTWWHEADYSREFVRQQETMGDFPGGLKDLDTDNPDVTEALGHAFELWIEAADFDGFRIDTVKHIDRPDLDLNQRGFWGRFLDRMRAKAKALGKQNFFLFGESFDGNDTLDGQYTFGGTDTAGSFGRFDSVFYFSQYYEGIVPVFKQGAPTQNLACLYDARMGLDQTNGFCRGAGYPTGPTYQATPHATPDAGGIGLAPQQVLVSFLDNHDLPRFLFQGNTAQLRSALAYIYTWDGLPCLYYGTEQLFAGGVDPANREDMFAGNPSPPDGLPAIAPFDTTQPFFKFVQGLIAMRKQHEALRRGTVDIRWATTQPAPRRDAGLFAFERSSAGEHLLVVLNTGDQDSETCAPTSEGGLCMVTTFAPGTVLTDVAPGAAGSFTVGAGGTVTVAVPARGFRVLSPQ